MSSWFLLAAAAGLLATAADAAQPMSSFDDAYKAVSARRISLDTANAFAKWYGEENLKNGVNPKSDDLRFIFAVSAPAGAAKVTVDSADGSWSKPLKRLGPTDVFVLATSLPEAAGFRWAYHADGTKIGGGDLEAYTYPLETKPQPDVPKGTLTEQPQWHSNVYAGTTRHWWIYVPTQYDPSKPANLYVIQDAQWSRSYWVPVLDNLIAKKEIPVTIAVFLTPGTIKTDLDNRSIEYDTVSDRYATMLADEIIPEVEKQYNISKDPADHLISGLSSGGICSFNAAWFRPDLFGKVLSWIGSFTNLQGGPTGTAGGNTYPAIIRKLRGWDKKGEPKPIRVFLQDGLNDLDNAAGNWPLSNQQMAKALEYGGYDVKLILGNGFHSDKMGRAHLPEALRWLFR